MKKKLFLGLLLLITVYSFSIDKPKPVKSKIKNVTVFLNGAQINRTASTQLSPDVTYLLFENLPQNINAQSIQVKGKGNFIILSVKHQINYLKSQKKTKEIINMEDSLVLLQDKLNFRNSMLSVYSEEEAMIKANRAIGGNDNGVNITDLKTAVEYFRSRLTDIKTKQLGLNKEILKLNKEISQINNHLNQANAKKNQPTSEIIVTVSAKAATTAKFDLSYLVMGAGWTPTYDLRAKDVKNPIELFYKANVRQSTGENWDKVNLTLSTGNPTISGTKPILNAWYLNFNITYEVDKEKYNRASKGIAKESVSAYKLEDIVTEEETGYSYQYTQASESQTSVEFKISIPYDVPSDNKVYTVDIQKYSLDATYKYFAVPKLDKDAFLLAQVTGWEEYNLLSGNVNLFFEGTYIGKSHINVRNTKDTLDFSLGRDKNIVVTRIKLKEFSSKKMIGLNQKEIIAWEINVKNKKKQNIDIIIEDQFPISSNKDIVVEHIEYIEANYNKDTGKLIWNLKLKPSESKKMKLMYSVKYPKNQTIYLN